MFSHIGRWLKNGSLLLTYSRRIAWLNRVMQHLKKMVANPEVRMHLPEAVERFEYLQQRQALVLPHLDPSGDLVLSDQLVFNDKQAECQLPPLLIFPMLPGDAHLGRMGSYYHQAAGLGSYSAAGHLIILRMRSGETGRFMASTLLHEVGHAIAAERGERSGRPGNFRHDREKLEEELQMWHFDCRLAGWLGGESFRAQTEARAREITQRLAAGIYQLGLVGDGIALDACYGPAVDKKTADGRAMLYSVQCELIALHMYYGPYVAHEYQLALMEYAHQKSTKKRKELLARFSR